MTAIKDKSPLFEEIFGGTTFPSKFDSGGLSYTDLANAFLDPANRLLFNNPGVIHASQSRSLLDGMRLCLRSMSVDFGDDIVPNIPSSLLNGVASLVKANDIPAEVSLDGMKMIFSTVSDGKPIGTASAVLGVGLAAVGVAVPVVGLIASAIIALASGLYTLIHNQQAKLDAANAEHRALLYQTFPPLQEADSEFDSKIVDQVVLPMVRTRDWTRLFLPRFEGDQWVGVERDGGFAFAPGKPDAGNDGFGAMDVFTPTDCIGVLPGSNQVTSVVQVSLAHDPADPAAAPFVLWTKGVGPDLRSATGAWRRVQDTGVYYEATGRIAFSLWSMALKRGSPYKYCLDAVSMHEAWLKWAESGVNYIREVCYPWMGENKRGDGTIRPNADYEGYFGTAVYHAVGAWAGWVDSANSTSTNFRYHKEPGYGVTGPYIQGASPLCYGHPDNRLISARRSGSWLPIQSAESWPDNLMGTRYHLGGYAGSGPSIKSILDDLQRRQRYELGSTLVSAYVSSRDAAFAGDPKLADELYKWRAKLLASEDRYWVNLADVVQDEQGIPGLPGTWAEQLVKAGVPPTPRRTMRRLAMTPSGTAPPTNPPVMPGPGDPWDPTKHRVGRPSTRGGGGLGLLLGLGGIGIVGGGLLAAHILRQKPRRNFSGGRR